MLAKQLYRKNRRGQREGAAGVIVLVVVVLALSITYTKADAAEAIAQVPNRVFTLNAQVIQLSQAGKYAEAIAAAEEATALAAKVLGPDHPDTATSQNNLAEIYRVLGRYAKAEPLFKRSLGIYESTFGPEHTNTAVSLNNLALLYYEMGKYAKSEPLYQRSLTICENRLGPEHPDTARSLNNLAELYRAMSDFSRAEPLCQRALVIHEKTLGPEHPNTALSLNNLAIIYVQMGIYAKAIPLQQRALKIQEKTLSSKHPNLAVSLNNLAACYQDSGDYAQAEPLYQRALKICEEALGPEHPGTANSLNNLAEFYQTTGNYASSEQLYERALLINTKALGPNHPNTATVLDNLAMVYERTGDYAKVKQSHERALMIRENVFGPDNPGTATSLNNLGVAYHKMSEYAKAKPLLDRALKISQKALGPDHPHTARSLHSLAALYESMGDYISAARLYERALKIKEKTLGPEHPEAAASLNNLALLCIDTGNTLEAQSLSAKSQRVELTTLASILSFTSGDQRLAYQRICHPFTLPATLGSVPELSAAILHWKGVVLDSVLEDRQVAHASRDPAKREMLEQIVVVKRRLAQLLFETPKDFSAEAGKQRETQRAKLTEELGHLEGVLARDVVALGRTRRALGMTVGAVQRQIPTNTELIELIRYDHYLGKGKGERRYGAIILAGSGAPQWVVLGASDAIERTVAEYQKAVREKRDDDALSTVLRTLHQQVWAPIEKLLPQGCRSILISPDGELNFVSFAILLTEKDQFLSQKYQISYLASGRDLMREKTVKKAGGMLAVWANPVFNKQPSTNHDGFIANSGVLRELERSDFGSLRFQPLPGAQREGLMLEQKASAWGYAKVMLRAGEEATEAALRQVQEPMVLHLATHGFFLSDVGSEPANVKSGRRSKIEPMDFHGSGLKAQARILKSPMHRSGLALAGAETTLAAWKRGEAPPPENDGILTAEEVGELNLEGTWLVTLSACDTGMGEARNGEGVLGLRRGFIQAGAQNLLMTLWPVNDQFTTEFMAAFYERAMRSGDAPRALADVQRDYLQKQREFGGIGSAVRLAGPFVMNFQGPVSTGVNAREDLTHFRSSRIDPPLHERSNGVIWLWCGGLGLISVILAIRWQRGRHR